MHVRKTVQTRSETRVLGVPHARATGAPFHVNYHIEQHVIAAAPYFRLPIMHRLLRERGMVAEPPGYIKVWEYFEHFGPEHAVTSRFSSCDARGASRLSAKFAYSL